MATCRFDDYPGAILEWTKEPYGDILHGALKFQKQGRMVMIPMQAVELGIMQESSVGLLKKYDEMSMEDVYMEFVEDAQQAIQRASEALESLQNFIENDGDVELCERGECTCEAEGHEPGTCDWCEWMKIPGGGSV